MIDVHDLDGALKVKLLTPTATAPRRAEAGSVGYDVCADLRDGDVWIAQKQREVIRTGIAVAVPRHTYGRVAPRSGMALKHGIDVLAGVIDPSYRGEVCVILFNSGDSPVQIKHGDRIAQLILERCETPYVAEVDALDTTQRGAAGFGSSGR